MPDKALALSRRALRLDQVLEIHFSPLPEPPAEMMKLPGVRAWIDQLKLMRERDTQTFQRMVNNLQISSNNASG